MAARGSKLSRAVAFFREGDLDEVRVAFTLVKEAVEKRLKDVRPAAKPRKARRTKAQIAADQAASSAS
jgi:hypothetical protein